VVLIGDETEKIERALTAAAYKGQIRKGFSEMDGIVKAARELSSAGDVVILSPACASFDMFKNYKDRGEKFKKAVASL
jgi:UDP-N-acetylmuramoylalanine--D-glutamate ligase